MDTNNFFSFSRIAMVMKREIMENWKTNLYRLIGIYAAFALVMILHMWTMSSGRSSQISFTAYCSNIMGTFVFIIGIASIALCCQHYGKHDYQRKTHRFSDASGNHDREICGTVLNCYGRTGGGCLCCGVIGGNYPLSVIPLFNVPETFHQSVLYNLLSMASVDGEQIYRGSGYAMNMPYQNWLGELCGWAFLVWSHSLYILGGSYWYKKPFFKTLGTLMLISILCSVLSVHIISWVGNDGMRSFAEWLEANSQWMTLNKLLSLGVAFFSAFTMFNWWLSYRLFTRSQVIKPKFRLL